MTYEITKQFSPNSLLSPGVDVYISRRVCWSSLRILTLVNRIVLPTYLPEHSIHKDFNSYTPLWCFPGRFWAWPSPWPWLRSPWFLLAHIINSNRVLSKRDKTLQTILANLSTVKTRIVSKAMSAFLWPIIGHTYVASTLTRYSISPIPPTTAGGSIALLGMAIVYLIPDFAQINVAKTLKSHRSIVDI